MFALDTVVIDYVFHDETAWTDPTLYPRWQAELRLFRLVVLDEQPIPGKRVYAATLIPREPVIH